MAVEVRVHSCPYRLERRLLRPHIPREKTVDGRFRSGPAVIPGSRLTCITSASKVKCVLAGKEY